MKKIRKLLLFEASVKNKEDITRVEEHIKLFGSDPDIKLTEVTLPNEEEIGNVIDYLYDVGIYLAAEANHRRMHDK